MKNLKEMIPYHIKVYIKYLISPSENDIFSRLSHLKDKPKVIITLAADYTNLGDMAIVHAQREFLKTQFPKHEIIELPFKKTYSEMKSLKKICSAEDIITISGGGFTGDLYPGSELFRQFVIQQFPKNRIISFPQTIDFSSTPEGKKLLKKAKKVYSHHKCLVLIAREKKSLELHKTYFPENKVLFTPDIALSLNKEFPTSFRNGIVLCLRKDIEKAISDEEKANIINNIPANYDITNRDTRLDYGDLSVKERNYELNKIWDDFKQGKLVITDRLHGMIFCAITKTPCIAFDNSTKKVSNLYESWLKDLEYIKLIKKFDLNEFNRDLEYLTSLDLSSIKSLDLTEQFAPLLEECRDTKFL